MRPSPEMADNQTRIEELTERLTVLDRQRAAIKAEIDALCSKPAPEPAFPKCALPRQVSHSVDRRSTIEVKIALFRRLFRGRADVFPVRWENGKTGRSGYSPACANEWRRGVCEKPKVKCSTCPNQAFVGVDDVLIERHLRGAGPDGTPFVMGVYPMLPDDSCWFLAADFDEGEWRREGAGAWIPATRTSVSWNLPNICASRSHSWVSDWQAADDSSDMAAFCCVAWSISEIATLTCFSVVD